MPFQGNGGRGAIDPGIVNLLFAQQQARSEQRRQMMLDAAKMQADQQKAQLDATLAMRDDRRKEEEFRLKRLKEFADLQATLGPKFGEISEARRSAEAATQAANEAAGARVGDLSMAANQASPEQLAPMEEQEFLSILSQVDPQAQAALASAAPARQFYQDRVGEAAQLRQGITGGTFDESVASTLGGAQAFDLQEQRAAALKAGVKTQDAEREDAFARRREARAEARAIRAEQRNRVAQEAIADAEANAAAAGKWTGADLDKVRTAQESRLSFAPDVTKEWRRFDSLNPNNPQDVFEIIQKWQRRVDEGATVREGDIDMIRAVGASGAETFSADARAFFDGSKKFPPGFGKRLFESYKGLLSEEDGKIVDLAGEFDAYAEANGWTPAQKARASAYRKEVERATERLSGRSRPAAAQPNAAPAAGGAGMTKADFDRIAADMSRATGIPIDQIPDKMVADAFRFEQGGGQ